MLNCYFWIRNARKLNKVWKNADSSLVSNENFSDMLPPSSLADFRYQLSKMAKNLPHLCRHSQKKTKPKTKFFFIPDLKTCWVFWGFEQLFSTINWGALTAECGSGRKMQYPAGIDSGIQDPWLPLVNCLQTTGYQP